VRVPGQFSYPQTSLSNSSREITRRSFRMKYLKVLNSRAVSVPGSPFRKPHEDSPRYRMDQKSIAKRVQRFLKEAEQWWKFEGTWQECENEYDRLEADDLLAEADSYFTGTRTTSLASRGRGSTRNSCP
jgi:hypothetical protein